MHRGILIVDYGSQYTMLITRKLREMGYYSEIHSHTVALDKLQMDIGGVILSGGPDSVSSKDGRPLPDWFDDVSVPVLGICYGMQLLAQRNNCPIISSQKREYGKAILHITKQEDIFANVENGSTVWMSHGDSCEVGDQNHVELLALSDSKVPAGIKIKDKKHYGIQFHPEVFHTTQGPQILKNFCSQACELSQDWQAHSMVEMCLNSIKNTVGPNGKVLMAVSGGVDSSVAYALMIKALGSERVNAVMVDHGLLRYDEAKRVRTSFERAHMVPPTVINSGELFLKEMEGVTDPEQKRKIIGRLFVEEFERFAKDQQGLTHLGQGTLYPDVIESAGDGAGSHLIKTHHNVGGLPEKLKLDLVEPFKNLFKDEVRAVGRAIGLEESLIDRHPFPGPGLGVRILGAVDQEKVTILQKVDEIYMKRLRASGLYAKVWQAFAVFLPVHSVGVMGDQRTYAYTIALRAVDAVDGMTAEASSLPMDFLTETAREIVAQVPEVNRVTYDVTSKPPGTIEWE